MTIQAHIPQIVATAIVVITYPPLKVLVRRLIVAYGKRSRRSDKRVSHMLRVVNIIINLSFILTLAIIWGVNTQNVLVTLSSIFAVIGVAMFAQWSILSNITAGILIFFATPFHVGDEIHIMDKDMPIKAMIEDIFTFHIHLRTKDGELIIIPNNLFLQKIVSIEKLDEW